MELYIPGMSGVDVTASECSLLKTMENTDKIRRPGQKAALLAVIGLIVAGFVYGIFWYLVSSRVLEALEEWATQQRQAGHDAQWETVDVSGFPFRVALTVAKPTITNDRDDWHWAVDALTIKGRPWNWAAFDLDAAGEHQVTVHHADGRVLRDYRVDFDTLYIEAVFTGDQWREIDVAANNISMQGNGQSIADVDVLSGHVGRAFMPNPDDRTRTGQLELMLGNVVIPSLAGELSRVAGNTVQAASLRAELYGPIPSTVSPSSLTVWRDAGGVVEVRDFHTDYGPLGLDAEGALALDGSLQPIGSFLAEIAGVSEIIDLMAVAGMITEGNALATKLVLGALSKRDAATGTSRVTLPVTLQDGMLHAGPVPLFRVPRVHW